MADYLDAFITDLLHLDDGRNNKLLDVSADGARKDGDRTYVLTRHTDDDGGAMLNTIARRVGKLSNNTVLDSSSLMKNSAVNVNVEKWDWHDLSGVKDAKKLDKFISDVYAALNVTGNNPLFLGVGALKWKIAVGDKSEKVTSPMLIFPIRLVRGTSTSLVEIEFVDEDAYFNPCLISKLRSDYNDYCSKNFPHPNGDGVGFDEPIDLEKLSDGSEYFEKLQAYLDEFEDEDGSKLFTLDKNSVVIAQYSHSDLCMYYDVRRCRDRIYSNPLIAQVFGQERRPSAEKPSGGGDARLVLPSDSNQRKLISKVVGGGSMIIKGPPGTGKTVTIANMIVALMSSGKSVLLSSKKLSALCEVYAKLPEELRRFVLLMEAETEKAAAKISPESIRRDLKDTLRYKKEYKYDPAVPSLVDVERRNLSAAVSELEDYYGDMFAEGVAGMSYYDALDIYFKHPEMPAAPLDGEDVALVTRSGYEALKSAVRRISALAKIMVEGVNNLSECAFAGMGVREDVSDISRSALKIADDETAARAGLTHAIQKYPEIPFASLDLGTLICLLSGRALSKEDIAAIAEATSLPYGQAEISALKESYVNSRCEAGKLISFTLDPLDKKYSGMESLKADGELTLKQLKDIYINRGAIKTTAGEYPDDVACERMAKAAEKLEELAVESRKAQLDCSLVFDKQLDAKQQKCLLEAVSALSPYFGQESVKLPFAARRVIKKLSALTSGQGITDIKMICAVEAYGKYVSALREAEAQLRLINACVGRDLSEVERGAVSLIFARSRALKLGAQRYISLIEEDYRVISEALNEAEILSDDCTIRQFIDAFCMHKARVLLVNAIKADLGAAGVGMPAADEEETADALIAALGFARLDCYVNADEEGKKRIIAAISDIGRDAADALELLANDAQEFGKTYFKNRYTSQPLARSLDDFALFGAQARDRRVISAALDYYAEIEASKKLLDLAPVFACLADGGARGYDTAEDLFEHSFIKAVLDLNLLKLGRSALGLGERAALAIDRYGKASDEINKLNIKRIENLCLARVDEDDYDFDFLSVDKGARMSARGLFKNYAAALLKLKRCFIMSPSTVSVMLRPEEYFDFDVAIIDEASQLEPVNLLPILMRAKQCVLVGDEFQMPPISHFKAKRRDVIIDYEKELEIDHDISALSLALENLAFDAEELTCHYRSNTESLIAFSQREFYPHMRTFPAAVPFMEDTGFEDVYVENARCDDGVNMLEAKAAVDCLKRHFDRYYDEAAGLKKSVGIVAFGEAQLKAILNLVAADTELDKKRANALDKFDDVAEKLIFFKTIETVQGQETDHLILSLTYGVDADGNVRNRFGELNRDELGKCIFNVAVTRAKDRVTLIHSVRANQLDGSSKIGYIADYIRLVEKFAKQGKGQFVSNPYESGAHFINDVAKFIASLGISEDRIVTGYGVTDGSVRIPIAVLSEDMTRAVAGIWCELPVGKKYGYIDYNVGYFNSLTLRGWKLMRLSIHDWYDNAAAEKRALEKFINTVI